MPSVYNNYQQIDNRQNRYGQYQRLPRQSASATLPPTYTSETQPGMPLAQRPGRIAPMPKAQALELIEKFKRGIVVVSLVGFGTLSVLVLSNTNLAASGANQATPASNNLTNPSSDNSSDSGSDSSSNSIFPQQQGGYGFGSDPSSQGPAASSHNS